LNRWQAEQVVVLSYRRRPFWRLVFVSALILLAGSLALERLLEAMGG
jgi:hypothetical protein